MEVTLKGTRVNPQAVYGVEGLGHNLIKRVQRILGSFIGEGFKIMVWKRCRGFFEVWYLFSCWSEILYWLAF